MSKPGVKYSKEHDRKMKETMNTPSVKKILSQSKLGDKNPMKRKEVYEKCINAMNSDSYKKSQRNAQFKRIERDGYMHSEEALKKMSISAVEYIKNMSNGYPTRVGRNEKVILDKLQKMLGFSIKRQFYVNGYWLDGYCQELNLALEIDEKEHYSNNILSEKDIEKQNNIMKILNCDFMRIRVDSVMINNEINIKILEKEIEKIGGVF